MLAGTGAGTEGAAIARHKKQHFVPQCYLKAWCDPKTPAKQEPYVWRFNKDGAAPRRKAPENIFYQTDLYTIRQADGGRDLVLERGLSGLEGEFVTIRDSKLALRRPLTPREHVLLCAFMAAAYARTPAQRDHLGAQWAEVLEKMDAINEWAENATPEQRRSASTLGRGSGPSFGYQDVKKLAEQPMQTMLGPQVEAATPLLAGMDCAILNCTAEPGFITSDNPCVWFDPEAYKLPPIYQGVGLGSPTVEITFPVSPRQVVFLNRKGLVGHFHAPEKAVDKLNGLTRVYCSEHFVSNSEVMKPAWFDLGVEPEDSWRKRQARDRTAQEE